MYKNKTIGVVVPAYNEEPFIGEVVQTMPDYVDRIYVINDCSEDDTLKIVSKISSKRLTVINHEKRRGPGAAMLTGYKKARENNIDVVAIMAGTGRWTRQFWIELSSRYAREKPIILKVTG